MSIREELKLDYDVTIGDTATPEDLLRIYEIVKSGRHSIEEGDPLCLACGTTMFKLSSNFVCPLCGQTSGVS